jgi:hypothetical protein
MKNTDYNTTILVNGTLEEAFQAINAVKKWWTENVDGNSQKVGDEFTVTFGTTWKTFKIVEMVPSNKIVWEVMDCNLPWNDNKTEWTGTKIIFGIKAKDRQAEINFIHQGLVPAFNCYDACSNAWGEYLYESLAELINRGKGKPNPKEEKKGSKTK